ncbi:MAG TPA: carbon monoxide dehydrogenase subunit G [Aliidongia sp.]|nr:carbon monoxide dehydrogenase subunit G [Aliidongia sp.]
MDMSGEYRIAAPREKVWAALNDAEILRQCIPGCDEIDKSSDTEFSAKVTAKVGPVKAKFGGKVTLSDLDPPNGYTITGEGSGGAAGFAKGGAKVSLASDGADTILSYTVQANVGGKLAQIGSRLIDGTARKMAEDFFGTFSTLVAANESAPPPAAAPVELEPIPAVDGAASMTPEPSAVPPQAAAAAPAPPRPTPTASGGLPPAVWITGLVIIVAALLWFFT